MNTMTDLTALTALTALQRTLSAPSAFVTSPFVPVGASSMAISPDSAFGMGAYAAADAFDGRVLPCAPVVTQKRTEAGVAVPSTHSSFSSKRCLATHATNPTNPVVKTWPLRPSGICGAPPG